jgi:hypothetical protein
MPIKTSIRPTRPRSWRDYPDSSHTNRLNAWPSPESLRPSESTLIAAISGDESCQAIVLSYASPVIPVVTVQGVIQ